MLCATTPNLTDQLRQTLWRQQKPMILTSGTLAVGEDFRRFKEATGLADRQPCAGVCQPLTLRIQQELPDVCFPPTRPSGGRTIL